MFTVSTFLSSLKIQQKNIKNVSSIDVEILLCHVLGFERSQLYISLEKTISETQMELIRNLIDRKSQGEPTWYIVGVAPFWKYEFKVGKGVLVPRKETEFMVEAILEDYQSVGAKTKGLELGSGSGAIALSIAKENSCFEITSYDVSVDALNYAALNKKALDIENVNFVHTYNLEFLENKTFDFFFSNPPYIKTSEISTLQPEVKDYEPITALDGREDGLFFYKYIADNARKYLKSSAKIYLEIGAAQAKDVKAIFKDKGFRFCRSKFDYSGFERILIFNS